MSTLQLRFLGTLDICYDDQLPPKPPTLKSQSLLAYLILHRYRPQPRDRLAGLLWGERPERKAHRSLTTALWHIRRCLPRKELILSDFHTVQFDPQADLWLDVDEFKAQASHDDIASLQLAAALYRGDFLDGFYDDWIINERYRLEALFLETLARLMVGYETRGDHQAALPTALRLLGYDPLREDAYRLAMRAYCRLGQRNAALGQYICCREIVLEELGTEPMVETTELYQAILEGRFKVGPLPEILSVEMPVIGPAGRSPLDVIAPVKLVGRDQEMAFLHGCWQRAQAGHGGLALISGEAGVGKTRLVEEFAKRLRWQGVRVPWGRCYEFERILPYQPIGEVLRAVIPLVSPAELTVCPPWALGQVARIAPQLRDRYPDVKTVPVARPDQEQVRLFDSILRFLAEISRHGALLIVLEDLHWASESTLALLGFLARHLAEYPILMIGTLRPEELVEEHRLRDLQRRLEREGVAASLRLPRLSLETVKMLVQEMSGVQEAVDPLAVRLYQETEGNPFFLMELLKALFSEDVIRLEGNRWRGDFSQISRDEFPLPSSVTEAIQARVGQLGQDTQEAMCLSAVLGREFDFNLLNAAWACGEEATLAAVDDLLRRRLIEEVTNAAGRDYAFTHHKIQEVVYTGMLCHHRQLLHRQVGAAMERLSAPDTQEVAGELAFHFERARGSDLGLTGKAIAYLKKAGDQARQAYAYQEAIDYCRRALTLLKEIPPDEAREDRQSEIVAQLYEAVGEMLELTGHHKEARGAYQEALAQVSKRDLIRQSRLYRRTGKSWEVPLCFEEAAQAYDLAESVLGQKPTEPDQGWWQEWIEVQVGKMWLHYWQRQVHKMGELTEKVRHTVEQYGTPVQCARFSHALVSMAQARGRYRATQETIDLARASLSASQALNDPTFIAFAQFSLGFSFLWRDELAEAEDTLQSSLSLAERTGDIVLEARCLSFLTLLSRRRGQVENVRRAIPPSLAAARAAGVSQCVGTAQANLAWVAWREGVLSEAEANGQAALETWKQFPNFPLQWTALWPLTGVALARREVGRAMDSVRILLDPLQQRLPEEIETALEKAVDAWDQDRADAAQGHLQQAVKIAAGLGYL